MNNQDVYILGKVNDLALRWSITPIDLEVELVQRTNQAPGVLSLEFNHIRARDGSRDAFTKMLASLGIQGQDWSIDATIEEIDQRLDNALNVAPRAIQRG